MYRGRMYQLCSMLANFARKLNLLHSLFRCELSTKNIFYDIIILIIHTSKLYINAIEYHEPEGSSGAFFQLPPYSPSKLYISQGVCIMHTQADIKHMYACNCVDTIVDIRPAFTMILSERHTCEFEDDIRPQSSCI